jgi:hypothetical protein
MLGKSFLPKVSQPYLHQSLNDKRPAIQFLRLTSTMICDYCQENILRSPRTWYYHHSDVELFEQSFLSGCVFCTRLIKHMESRQFLRIGEYEATQVFNTITINATIPSHQGQVITWLSNSAPFFRWTIRKLVKTRDIQDCICVTFRPLPGFDGMDASDDPTGPKHLVSTTNDQDAKSAPKSLPDVVFYFYPDQGNSIHAVSSLSAFTSPYIFTYSLSGPRADACPYSHELGDRTDSEKTWAQIISWTNKCRDGHQGTCRRSSLIPEGIRLLDIESSSPEWPPKVKVIERNSSPMDNERYVTLSHCWGSKGFVKLTTGTYDTFTSTGVPWKDIKTNENFVGAVQVAWKLGVRYIWIDSLCIKQDDAGDWDKQAGKMKDVYRHSYCNISASSSPDCGGGLFHDRDSNGVGITRYTGVSGLLQGRTWRIIPGDLWKTSLLGEPLYSRAWVFQGETHLSSPHSICG